MSPELCELVEALPAKNEWPAEALTSFCHAAGRANAPMQRTLAEQLLVLSDRLTASGDHAAADQADALALHLLAPKLAHRAAAHVEAAHEAAAIRFGGREPQKHEQPATEPSGKTLFDLLLERR